MGIDLNLAKVLLDTGEDVGVVRGLPHAEHKNRRTVRVARREELWVN